MNPKISIVMPTYNRASSFLKDAIFSVLDQTYKNFELVIVDDASLDNTERLISSINDKRISYYKTDYNHGEYWSTNYGVSQAKGAYLTWVHSDDLLPKDSLKIRKETLDTNPNLDFVHGDIVKIDTKGNVIEKLEAVDWTKEKILSEYLLLSNKREKKYLIHHTTIMMQWGFFYKAGPLDCSLPFAGDIDWLIRAIKGGNFRYVHEVLYCYRSHPQTRRVIDIKSGVDKEKVNKMIIRRYV